MSREWDVDRAAMPDIDTDATPDFRWPYFSSLAMNGLAAATRQMRAENKWLKARMSLVEMSDLKKAAVRDVARAEAKVRGNMSADSIKQHGGSTAKERLEYVERIVAGAPEVQDCASAQADVARRIADLELEAEKAEKTWTRQDRLVRFFEHVLDSLSTFAPESAGGAAALTGQLPVLALDRGLKHEHRRFAPGVAPSPELTGDEPPPGFVEDTEIPF